MDVRTSVFLAPLDGERGVRGSELLECSIRAAGRLDCLAQFDRDDGCPRLAALGQEDTATEKAHRGDQLSQVRPCVGDGQALVIHKRSVPNAFGVQQVGQYNETVTSPYKTETRHHPDGKLCHHFAYHRLTCDEYDAVRARAAGHCEICGIAEEDTARGVLDVDHFEAWGVRFTRGMLCSKCNGGVMPCIDGRKVWGANRKWEAKAREYEANSWEKPSLRALELMAARVEMRPKNPPRRPPSRETANVIPIPAKRGVAAMADSLRKWLTTEELAELTSLLVRESPDVA
jgi:hypothetical protein